MGTWIDGCVPDSRRYVPGRRLAHVRVPQPAAGARAVGTLQVGAAVAATAATSPATDRTRGSCGGGAAAPAPAIGHVVAACALEWSGLAVEVAVVPSPAPTCPTIMREV